MPLHFLILIIIHDNLQLSVARNCLYLQVVVRHVPPPPPRSRKRPCLKRGEGGEVQLKLDAFFCLSSPPPIDPSPAGLAFPSCWTQNILETPPLIFWIRNHLPLLVFANGQLYFTRDVPEANCMPQVLEPPVKLAAKPAPKAAKPPAKPSKRVAKPAAQVAAKPAAKPAAGEPNPVAPVEHVQLFKVKYLHQKKVAHRGCCSVDLTCIPAGSFLVSLWFTCPRVLSLVLYRVSFLW